MINAERISKIYGSGDNKVVALEGINLQVAEGERIALLGRSGSGKTSLVNLLAGLDRPSSGLLEIAGQGLQAMNSADLALYRRDRIGVVFQSFQLIAQRTAQQNVELPLILTGISRRERMRLARESLEKVGLGERLRHRPYQLSGGEQQRVAIARAIVNQPSVLLADEPTGNLDSKTAGTIEELLMKVCEESGATLVLITHDESLATRSADRVYHLRDGRLEDVRRAWHHETAGCHPDGPPQSLVAQASHGIEPGRDRDRLCHADDDICGNTWGANRLDVDHQQFG